MGVSADCCRGVVKQGHRWSDGGWIQQAWLWLCGVFAQLLLLRSPTFSQVACVPLVFYSLVHHNLCVLSDAVWNLNTSSGHPRHYPKFRRSHSSHPHWIVFWPVSGWKQVYHPQILVTGNLFDFFLKCFSSTFSLTICFVLFCLWGPHLVCSGLTPSSAQESLLVGLEGILYGICTSVCVYVIYALCVWVWMHV